MAIREPTEVDGVSDRSGFRRVAGAILDGARRKRREFAHALRICLRFMPFLRHERRRLLILVGLMLLTGLVSRVMPLIGKYMVDDVLPHHVWSMFWLVTVGLVGVSAILGLLSIYHSYVSLCLDSKLNTVMSVAYFRCLASLPLEDVERKQVGAHIYRATSDISAVQNLVMSVFSGVASHLVPLIVAVGIMLTLDWRIGLAFLACVPIPPLLRVWISLRLKPLERDTRDLNEHIGGFLGRSLSAIKVMKAFGSETSQSLKYLRLMREAVRLNFRVWAATTLLSRIEWFFSSGLGMLFQWCILFMLMKDHTTLGSAVALSWYFSLIVGPFMGFATIVQNVIAGSVAGERVLEVLEGPKERVYEGPRVPRPRSGSAIRMRDVRFAYSGGQDVLRNVTLDVPPGSVTALVGANGSGKTTIVNLICGFHTGYEGAISVNGLEVSDASLASLRKMIALVPQEATLLGDTVLDSIVCARPDAGMDDVVRAAKMARIHDRIMAMPTGYHTRLAGAGVELSAGERQKLVISRAFLREAPILILDEPFANLDAESEHKVLESVIGHEPGRTTLMITHHLSNIVLADHVVFIESGSVAASGLPRDVMKTLDDGASIVGA